MGGTDINSKTTEYKVAEQATIKIVDHDSTNT